MYYFIQSKALSPFCDANTNQGYLSYLPSLDVGSSTNGCGYSPFLEVFILSPCETTHFPEYCGGAIYFLKQCSNFIVIICCSLSRFANQLIYVILSN